MRHAGPLVGVAGIVLLSALAVFGGRTLFGPEAGPEGARPSELSATSATEAPTASGSDAPDAAAAAAARAVASGVVTAPQVDLSSLERVEPRAPLSPPQTVPKRPRGPTLLHRPVAEAAGRIAVDGLVIVPKGIVPLEPSQTCRAPDGTDWPCGMVARTAFRAWLRGRSISCELPEESAPGPVTVPCLVGKDDIAAWLIDNGWARAETGSPYDAASRAADAAGRGIFRDTPPG